MLKIKDPIEVEEDTRKPEVGWAVDKRYLSDICVCDVPGEMVGDIMTMQKPCEANPIYNVGELVYCPLKRYLACEHRK